MLDEFKQAFQRQNNAHVQLIIINVVIFLVLVLINVLSKWTGLEEVSSFIHALFSIPPKFADFLSRPWTLITYAFAHDLSGVFHILFNMLIFYWFGRLFVEYLGSDKLVGVYILGALAGAIAYLLMFNFVPYYIERSGFPGMVGASAAVCAVVVAVAVLIPNYTFYLLILGAVKAKYIAAFFVVTSFIGSVGDNDGGNIAHLGGALIGFIYMKQLQAGVNWGSWITVTLDWFKGLFKGSSKVKVTYRKAEPVAADKRSSSAPKTSQEEIDRILDKISDRGYESLTKDEKEKLFNASKK